MTGEPKPTNLIVETGGQESRIGDITDPMRSVLRKGLKIDSQPFAGELEKNVAFLDWRTNQLYLPGYAPVTAERIEY